MIAIGNDELGAPVKKGDYVVKGALKGVLQYGTDEAGKETDLLGFITTDAFASSGGEDKSYLVSIKGRLLEGWEIHKE